MTQKTKFILTYVAGIVTGIVLLFVVSFCINSFNNSKGSDGVVMFESPGDVVPARTLRVIQVLEENCALAMVDDIESDNIGVIVLLRGGKNTSFYDNQKIDIPSGQVARQVGTYTYMSRQNIEKTVPIVVITNN